MLHLQTGLVTVNSMINFFPGPTRKHCPRDIILDSSFAASFFSATFKIRNGRMAIPLFQSFLELPDKARSFPIMQLAFTDAEKRFKWHGNVI